MPSHIDRETLARFVRDDCAGNVKEAASRMGVSVSYILHVAPELKTKAQWDFDAKEGGYVEPTGRQRGEPRL